MALFNLFSFSELMSGLKQYRDIKWASQQCKDWVGREIFRTLKKKRSLKFLSESLKAFANNSGDGMKVSNAFVFLSTKILQSYFSNPFAFAWETEKLSSSSHGELFRLRLALNFDKLWTHEHKQLRRKSISFASQSSYGKLVCCAWN